MAHAFQKIDQTDQPPEIVPVRWVAKETPEYMEDQVGAKETRDKQNEEGECGKHKLEKVEQQRGARPVGRDLLYGFLMAKAVGFTEPAPV